MDCQSVYTINTHASLMRIYASGTLFGLTLATAEKYLVPILDFALLLNYVFSCIECLLLTGSISDQNISS